MDAAAPSEITVRPATPDDAEFLFGLWASVRDPVFDDAGHGPMVQLRHRYSVEQARHRETHPAAIHHVVELGRRPIGQCRLGPHPDAEEGQRRTGDALVMIDLSLLPTHQRLAADVVAALRRHAEWFGVELWADEAACTRHDRSGEGSTGDTADSADSGSDAAGRIVPGG